MEKPSQTKKSNRLKNLIHCPFCIYNTFNIENYKKHTLENHNGQRVTCDGCSETFEFIYELTSHRNEIHNFSHKYSIKHKIKDNLKEFLSFDKSTERRLKKQKVKWPRKERKLPITCPLCSYSTIGKSNFRNHYRLQHNNQELQCDGCSKKFHLFYRLYRHREDTHQYSSEYVIDSSLKVSDEVRQCTQGTRDYVKKNKRIRNKKLCHYCGKLVQSRNFETHIRNIHPEYREAFVCDYCKERHMTKNALLEHMQEYHIPTIQNTHQHQCLYCEKLFRRRTAQLSHEIRKHTHLYPFECMLCNKKFVDRHQLLQHLKWHLLY